MAVHVPSVLRFPLVAVLSFAISALLYSLAAEITGPELAAVSREITDVWHIGGLVAWRFAELSIAWYAGYGYIDLAYLTVLNNVPYYYLLNTFYGIRAIVVIIPLVIDIIAVTVPFALLRHSGTSAPVPATPSQAAIAQDTSIRLLTALLGAAIYASAVTGSFLTWLPLHMVLHFDGLRSLEKAHSTVVYNLFPLFIPLGLAVSQFLFVSAVSDATAEVAASTDAPFEPATASLGQTVAWNFGYGATRKNRSLARRSAILAACTFVNTVVRVYVSIDGTEIVGAVGWASVWAVATALVGVAFSWVGEV